MVAPAEKASLLGHSLTASSVVSSLSLLCLVCPSLGAILQPSKLCSHASASDTFGGVDPSLCFDVFPLFLKKVADIIAQN